MPCKFLSVCVYDLSLLILMIVFILLNGNH